MDNYLRAVQPILDVLTTESPDMRACVDDILVGDKTMADLPPLAYSRSSKQLVRIAQAIYGTPINTADADLSDLMGLDDERWRAVLDSLELARRLINL
jgi:hypothetical protein